MAFIKTLKDSNDNTIYPQSLISAILDADGNSLDTIHQKFITATAIEKEVEDAEIDFEKIENKTTSVTSISTDTQYPSAKAVYNAIKENIATGGGMEIQFFTSLEEITTPKEDTIYLVGSGTSYEEYVYLNRIWIKIGLTSADLIGYATEAFVNEKIANIDDYALKTEIPEKVSELENDKEYIANDTNSFVTVNYVWTGTQEQYETLSTIDANTVYNIIEE